MTTPPGPRIHAQSIDCGHQWGFQPPLAFVLRNALIRQSNLQRADGNQVKIAGRGVSLENEGANLEFLNSEEKPREGSFGPGALAAFGVD
jgi:hypothetical protein